MGHQPVARGATLPDTHAATHRPPRIVAVASAAPPHRVPQAQSREFVAGLFRDALGADTERLLAVFDRSGIEERRVCMPLEWYREPHDFGETNAAYLEHALPLARAAAESALARAGIPARAVTHLVFVSTTGIATPSIDARLAASAGFSPGVRRVPIWGLGCAGGAAGIARGAEFARATPDGVVLVIALELCSLTFQRRDLDPRNLVATALFADGAAAAVIAGADCDACTRGNGPGADVEVVASGSTLWPDTLDIMGWDVDASGLHVVFSRDIPTFVRRTVGPDLRRFLDMHDVPVEDLRHLWFHPGGPRVLEAFAESLAVPVERLGIARDVLRHHGNMSSPTCLYVLEAALAAERLEPGDPALLAALGPGFAAEYVLLRGA